GRAPGQLDLLVLTLHGVLVGGTLTRCRTAAVGTGRAGAGRRSLAPLAIHRRPDALHGLEQLVRRPLDPLDVVGALGGVDVPNLGLDGTLDVAAHLVAVVAQRPLGTVDRGVGVVADLDLFAALAVLLGVGLGVAHHALNFLLGEAAGGGDGDLLLTSRALIPGRDVHHAVVVNVEGHLDLGQAARRGRDAVQNELAQGLVPGGHVALALPH